MRTVNIPLPVARGMARGVLGNIINNRFSWARQRALIGGMARTIPLPPGTQVESMTLGGRPTDRLTVGAPTAGIAVLYLHGGGFTTGSPASHRSLAALIARDSGAAVYVVDYRLAPEQPFPAAVDDAVAAFVELVENHGFVAESIAVAGDSAGGGITVAAARRLIDDRGFRPAALGLLSPWVDPEAVLPSNRDTVLNVPWLRSCAAAYRGSASTDDPGYAPLHGNLSGLPASLIQIGTTELFHPQALRLAAKIEAAGGDVILQEFPALWHVAQLQAIQQREAAEAVAQFTDFLSARLKPVDVEPGPGDVA